MVVSIANIKLIRVCFLLPLIYISLDGYLLSFLFVSFWQRKEIQETGCGMHWTLLSDLTLIELTAWQQSPRRGFPFRINWPVVMCRNNAEAKQVPSSRSEIRTSFTRASSGKAANPIYSYESLLTIAHKIIRWRWLSHVMAWLPDDFSHESFLKKKKKAESSIIAVFRYRVQTLIHQSDISSQIHGWLAKFAEKKPIFPASNQFRQTYTNR